MKRPGGHPELPGQIRKPPLILCGTSRAKVARTPVANCSQPEPLEHLGDGLPAQSPSLLGRTVAFAMQRFGDLFSGEFLCYEFADTLTQSGVVAEALHLAYWPDHDTFGLGTPDPVDADVQPLAFAFGLDGDSLDDLAHYLLALGSGRTRRMPQRGYVLRQPADVRAFDCGKRPGLLVQKAPVVLLELSPVFELLFPLPGELTRRQPVLRLDQAVMASGPLRLV